MFESILTILSLLIIIGALLVILFSRNLLKTALGLVGVLLGVAVIYGVFGSYWLMTSQIMIYAGGIIILIFFSIILVGMDIERKEKQTLVALVPMMGNYFTYAMAALVAGITFATLFFLQSDLVKSSRHTSLPIEVGPKEFARALIGEHLLSFEVASVLLLVAMIGGAVIARPIVERRKL